MPSRSAGRSPLFGPVGTGNAFKLIYNVMEAIHVAARAVFGQMGDYDMSDRNDSELIDALRIARGRPRSK